ncbi:MAG: hypothetical protein HQK83_08030 [Fibrobacteria bacterium]|nr:hypothetical protein [Fibrobacteria bacterium]
MLEKPLSKYEDWYLSTRYPFGGQPLVSLFDSTRLHSFYASPHGSYGYSDSTSYSNRLEMGLRVYGNVKQNLTFYSHGRIFGDWTGEKQYDHQFDPDFGETCSAEIGADGEMSTSRTCNRFEHYIIVDFPWLSLKLGRDHVHMGPGYFSSLTATRNTPPYYLMEGRIDFADWLSLDNYFLKMTDSDHSIRKYMHIHRFEFKGFKSLSLAFQDVVIYQERDIDWKYILPLTPFAFSEDNTGGRDNDAMSFDFLYAGLPFVSVWGEVFIDDLLGPGTFFDDFWENRWALLGGFQVVSPWESFDADLVMEYSRVEPWNYNGRQSYTSFRHFNVPSASKLGPDSRSVNIQLSYRPLNWLQIREHLEFNAKGTDRGSNLGTIHDDDIDGKTKVFLENGRSNNFLTHAVQAFYNRYFTCEIFYRQTFTSLPEDAFGVSGMLSW